MTELQAVQILIVAPNQFFLDNSENLKESRNFRKELLNSSLDFTVHYYTGGAWKV